MVGNLFNKKYSEIVWKRDWKGGEEWTQCDWPDENWKGHNLRPTQWEWKDRGEKDIGI